VRGGPKVAASIDYWGIVFLTYTNHIRKYILHIWVIVVLASVLVSP